MIKRYMITIGCDSTIINERLIHDALSDLPGKPIVAAIEIKPEDTRAFIKIVQNAIGITDNTDAEQTIASMTRLATY